MTTTRAGEVKPDSSAWHTYQRLWRIVYPIRWKLLFGALCAMGSSLMALGIPQVIQYLVNTSLGPHPAVRWVLVAALAVLLLGVGEAWLTYMRRVFALYPSVGVETGMRVRLFDKLLRLPVSFHDEWGSGQLLSRSMSDLSQVRRLVAFGSIMLVSNVFTIIVGLILMVRANPLLALVFLVISIPLALSAFRFNQRYTTLSRRSQDQSGDLATMIEQSVEGIRVIKAFGRGREMLADFTDQARDLLGTEVSKAVAEARFAMASILLPEIALGLALVIGIWECANGAMTIGQLSAYFATVTLVTGPVRQTGNILGNFVNTRTALDRHFEVMDAPVTIADPDDPVIIDPRAATGALRLRDVHFRYDDAPPRSPDVLAGVDLELRPGETVALVGVTGSGKSTLLQLVPRLYDVTDGAVEIDGIDVRRMRGADLHTLTSVSFEDATLFSQSVRDNVLLGAPPDADQEELLRVALHTADADFVYDLSDGVDTIIGEQGLSLSGGQRQRLALARAIAAQPRVLLLDDPLSALDTETEEVVTRRLRRVLNSTTTLISAHRTSTVALADRVALLDEGRIAAIGTHAELLASNDRYRWVIAYLEAEHAGPTLDELSAEVGPASATSAAESPAQGESR